VNWGQTSKGLTLEGENYAEKKGVEVDRLERIEYRKENGACGRICGDVERVETIDSISKSCESVISR